MCFKVAILIHASESRWLDEHGSKVRTRIPTSNVFEITGGKTETKCGKPVSKACQMKWESSTFAALSSSPPKKPWLVDSSHISKKRINEFLLQSLNWKRYFYVSWHLHFPIFWYLRFYVTWCSFFRKDYSEFQNARNEK